MSQSHALNAATWRKSSRSGQQGQCVELAELGAVVAVRDSKNPAGPALVFGRPEFRSLIRRLQAE